MNATDYQRAYTIYIKVADLDPGARNQVLDEACGDNRGLRDFVVRLLDDESAPVTFEDAFAELVGGSLDLAWRPLELELGTVLHGRYEVRGLLGRGGTASVWKVWDTKLRSRHALKILEHSHASVRARMQRERLVQEQVHHHNVVAVQGGLEIDGRQALVTELVDGPDLEDYLRAHPLLTEAQVDAIALGVLAGVQAIHESGIIHRDIKPSNVLLGLEGGHLVPKVADFGIARPRGGDTPGLTQTGALIGTLAYMAPEHIRDARTVDERSDVWSLGCLLYRVVAGREAFAGSDNGETIQSVLSGRRPAIPQDLPERWRGAIAAALQSLPANRPENCATLRRLWQAPDGVLLQRPLQPASSPASGAYPSFDRNRFVGRQSTLAKVQALVASNRLVTILGVGGLGKTRLAVELGRRIEPDWPGGIPFVSLADVRTADGIVEATARALGMPLLGDVHDRLIETLTRRGPTLLVLDNFEQVVTHAAETVGQWLNRVPELHVLVTSRAPLELYGEQGFVLELLDEAEAVALFTERAREANAQFTLEGQQADVRRLVRLLDRLPLAIELAAARSRLLSPVALLSRLTRRFDVLKSPTKDIPERQRTLWATLQWSWELLTEDQRFALAQLSLFEGGFTLEAAQAVVELRSEAGWVEDVIFELANKGLVMTDGDRLRMLVSVREFAAAKLAGEPRTNDGGAAAAIRHGVWFASLADRQTLMPSRDGKGAYRPLRELDADRENFLVATDRALARGDHAVAGRCAQVASVLFRHFGPFEVGRTFVDHLLDHLTEPAFRAALLRGAAELRHITGAPGFSDLIQQAVEAARASGSTFELVYALSSLSDFNRGRMQIDAAQTYLDEALEVARRDGSPSTLLLPLARAGKIALLRAEVDDAETLYREALALAEHADEPETNEIGTLYGHYGTMCQKQGRLSEARTWYQRTIAQCREVGDLRGLPDWIGNVGNIAIQQGDFAEATSCFQEALERSRATGNRSSEVVWTANLGELDLRIGRLAEAETQLRRAHKGAQTLKSPVVLCVTAMNLGSTLRLMGRLDEAETWLTKAVETAEAGSNATLTGMTYGFLGRLYERQERFEEANQRYTDAVALTRPRSRPREFGYLLALNARLQSDIETGRALIAQSEALIGSIKDPTALATLHACHAVLEARVGDVEKGRTALDQGWSKVRDLEILESAEVVQELQVAARLLDEVDSPTT
ncbi:MAG: tetratricopeptide repeat protein [Myxococcota bacterium]